MTCSQIWKSSSRDAEVVVPAHCAPSGHTVPLSQRPGAAKASRRHAQRVRRSSGVTVELRLQAQATAGPSGKKKRLPTSRLLGRPGVRTGSQQR
jgi:hypothetical protein